uniref:Carboxypeptidase n=1 Tax=Rhabditophanes sp. KR3021 TaxID=114890 RepID=A0AC35UG98_9BILA
MKLLLLLLAALLYKSECAVYADKILNLPNLDFVPNFDQYAGYLQALPMKQLYYWLTMSQNSSATDPLILYMNGGPGCSSLQALLTEMGPYRVSNYGKTVSLNPYSWNKFANMLFIDGPAGVGYSFATDKNYTYSDDEVADQNYQALKYFFNVKFPELKSVDFYIAGESYSGYYTPMLSTRLIDDKANFANFKGMAIGNGCLDDKLLYNSIIQFSYNHAFIDETYYRNAVKKCCFKAGEDCDFYQYSLSNDPSARCYNESTTLNLANFYTGLDPYFLYFSCYLDGKDPASRAVAYPHSHRLAHLRHLSKKLNLNVDLTGAVPPPCSHHDDDVLWLNKPEVRQAINVPTLVQKYTGCSQDVGNNYITQYDTMSSFVIYALDAKIKTLFFNGDVDSVCNVNMNKQFLANLDRGLVQPATIWNMAVNLPPTAGFITKYKDFDFATIRGAGHFAASAVEKPREALQLIYNFVNNLDYSTPYPY